MFLNNSAHGLLLYIYICIYVYILILIGGCINLSILVCSRFTTNARAYNLIYNTFVICWEKRLEMSYNLLKRSLGTSKSVHDAYIYMNIHVRVYLIWTDDEIVGQLPCRQGWIDIWRSHSAHKQLSSYENVYMCLFHN